MSEKEVREETRRLMSELAAFMRADGIDATNSFRLTRAREALAQPPDLVELGRKIREFQIRRSLSVPTVDALKLVTRHIEKTVRLTDDGGWQYVEKDNAKAT